MKTKTLIVLANQRALLLLRNVKKNPKNNSKNNNVHNLINLIFLKICFFIVTSVEEFGNDSNDR